jgi:uncharacterized protein (DUF1778 family)
MPQLLDGSAKREHVVGVRFQVWEKRLAEDAARAAGLSLSSFVRRAAIELAQRLIDVHAGNGRGA